MNSQDNVMARQAHAVGLPTAKPDLGAYLHQLAASHAAPLVLIDPGLSILWANGAGHELLTGNGDVVLHEGRLRLTDSDTTATFHQFLVTLQDEVGAWLYRTPKHYYVIRTQKLDPQGQPPAYALAFYSNGQSLPYVWPELSTVGLTNAECRVLKGLVGGRTANDLAGDLGISNATVRTHIRRIYAKFEVSNREQLFSFVMPMRVL